MIKNNSADNFNQSPPSRPLLMRPLALTPAHETELGLENFLLLNERIKNLPLAKLISPEAKLIERSVKLFFHLIAGGAAVASRPFELLENLCLEPDRTLLGVIRLPKKRRRSGATLLGANLEGRRLYLTATARCHLISFVTFRFTEMEASAGDPFFPTLSRETIKKAPAELPWLRSIKGRISWQSVFLAFIRHELQTIADQISVDPWLVKISVPELAELALHRLYRDEPPLILELRRGSIGYASLPDAQYKNLFPPTGLNIKRYASAAGDAARAEIERIEEYYLAEFSLPVSEQETGDDFGGTQPERANATYSTLAAEKIRQLLRTIREGKSYAQAVKEAKKMLGHELFKEENAGDLRLVLLWLIGKLEKKKKKKNMPKSIETLAQIILYMIREFRGESFTEMTTEDLVIFLCQYGSAETAKNYRSAARDFHNFIATSLKLSVKIIDWKNPALKFSGGYREWKLISEAEFQLLLEKSPASNKFTGETIKFVLLLLRRAGLRCSEIAQLTLGNFSFGIGELTLRVRYSKSDAGRRSLPLYLLLSPDELRFVLDYLEAARRKASSNSSLLDLKLISTKGGTNPKPEQIGAEILSLCKSAGLRGHTAHGLRHAFASGLLAAWWLKLNPSFFNSSDDSRLQPPPPAALIALFDFCRPKGDGAVVTYADDIRRLLGHSSLSVTFDRYIHLCDLIVAAQVQLTEMTNPEASMSVNSAASLAGLTTREVRHQFPPELRVRKDHRAGEINLLFVEEWLKERLRNLKT